MTDYFQVVCSGLRLAPRINSFRQSGAKESLAGTGYSMHAVLTIGQLLDYWEENRKVEKDKIEETRKFLEESK